MMIILLTNILVQSALHMIALLKKLINVRCLSRTNNMAEHMSNARTRPVSKFVPEYACQ